MKRLLLAFVMTICVHSCRRHSSGAAPEGSNRAGTRQSHCVPADPTRA